MLITILPLDVRKEMKRLLNLAGYDPNNYNIHSFRAGGATTLARNGTPPSIIKAHGRWSSNIYTDYVRPNEKDLASLSVSFFKPPILPNIEFHFGFN